MTEVRRTSSIARRISWSWFFRSLSMLLLLDILVVALAAAGILYAGRRWAMHGRRNCSAAPNGTQTRCLFPLSIW